MSTGLQFMYTLRNVTQKFSKAFLSLSIHHGTHRKDGKVILFTPQEKYGLLYASSYETHKCQQCYTRIFHTQFQANRRKCIESKRVGMHLIPRGTYGFHFAGIHETQTHSVNFVDISFTEYYPKGGKIWKIGAKFYLRS